MVFGVTYEMRLLSRKTLFYFLLQRAIDVKNETDFPSRKKSTIILNRSYSRYEYGFPDKEYYEIKIKQINNIFEKVQRNKRNVCQECTK